MPNLTSAEKDKILDQVNYNVSRSRVHFDDDDLGGSRVDKERSDYPVK